MAIRSTEGAPGTAAAPAERGPAIRARGLTKDYGEGHGLFDLDLEVPRGEIFGFIGPNGAGKTTTMRLLMDLIRPDRGTATLLGLDARRDSLAVKRRVGYLPGELPRFPGVSAAHVVGLLAGLRGGVPPERIVALADRLEVDLRRRFEDLSHGNKQKVGLIQAFMHSPELLILDEPTLGLDPLMQREFRGLVQDAARDGATVLLSSHVLAEVELVCQRIGLVREGRLLRVGSLEELRTVRVHRVEAVVRRPMDAAELARPSPQPSRNGPPRWPAADPPDRPPTREGVRVGPTQHVQSGGGQAALGTRWTHGRGPDRAAGAAAPRRAAHARAVRGDPGHRGPRP